MNETLYQIRNLTQRYGDRTVLQIEDLEILEGSITGLVGPNGSGKSTLLRLLAFAERPAQGQILFEGKPAVAFDRSFRLQIALLIQEPYLFRRSVAENVAYGLKLRGDRNDLKRRVAEALSWVGLPAEEFARRSSHELSGGEAQRVALAARLILKPKVLLLDEPTANVDALSGVLIKDASLRARRDWGTTLIIASHDLDWLGEVADEVLHLTSGTMLAPDQGSILPGPWSVRPDGLYVKLLSNQESILAPSPHRQNATALVLAGSISLALNEPGNSSEFNVLSGIIKSMNLSGNPEEIVVTLMVDDLLFTVPLTKRQVQEKILYPGQKVRLRFPVQAIKWL